MITLFLAIYVCLYREREKKAVSQLSFTLNFIICTVYIL